MEVEAAGRKAVVVQVDISDEAQVATAFDRAVEAFGTVDILMDNAGVDASGTEVADLETEVWDTAIRRSMASSDSDYCTGCTFTMDGGLARNLGQGRRAG